MAHYVSNLDLLNQVAPVAKFRPTPLPKLMKALQKPVLALKIVKSFEVGNIN